MSDTTEAIRHHHQELLKTLERHAESLSVDTTPTAAQSLASFLTEELMPHAQGEELHLYPALNPLLREHTQPTLTMSLDHRWIEGAIRRINELARALPLARPGERASGQRELSRLALQLLAVVTLHVEKEEEAYLPVMERHMTAKRQRQILDRMHGEGETANRRSVNANAAGAHGHCHCGCGDHS